MRNGITPRENIPDLVSFKEHPFRLILNIRSRSFPTEYEQLGTQEVVSMSCGNLVFLLPQSGFLLAQSVHVPSSHSLRRSWELLSTEPCQWCTGCNKESLRASLEAALGQAQTPWSLASLASAPCLFLLVTCCSAKAHWTKLQSKVELVRGSAHLLQPKRTGQV